MPDMAHSERVNAECNRTEKRELRRRVFRIEMKYILHYINEEE
jgi:hypothetical protein